jgi:plasmid stabilization system protein ParE
MAVKEYNVVWTKKSQQHMKLAFDYISKDSVQNAIKVLEDLALAVKKAAPNPEGYPIDKYKKNNDGSYRAFEKHHYRIAYRYSNNIIRVVRVRHTSMEPKEY